MTEFLNELIGWFGAGAFVIAYLLLSLKILTSDRMFYHILNATGGIMMSVSTFNMNDRPAFFVNMIWMGIALFSIIRIYILSQQKL